MAHRYQARLRGGVSGDYPPPPNEFGGAVPPNFFSFYHPHLKITPALGVS